MCVPGKAHRTRRAQNVLDLVACETPEKRQVGDERGIESGHKNLCVTQWNRMASILANKETMVASPLASRGNGRNLLAGTTGAGALERLPMRKLADFDYCSASFT
jgi:hypothetical protein